MTQISKDKKYTGGGVIEIKKFAQPKTQTCSKRVSQDLTVATLDNNYLKESQIDRAAKQSRDAY